MPAINPVVRIEKIGDHVEQVIEGLNAKFWEMNQRGHFVQMPEELDFQMTVLVDWEALESTDKVVGETTSTDGGFSTETRGSSGTDEQTTINDTREAWSENSHGQGTTSSEKDYQI